MAIKKQYMNLLKSEAKRLKAVDEFENAGINIFDELFWGDYEVLYLILDDLGVPSDDEVNRDKYNNMYYDFYTSTNITDKSIQLFIKKLEKISK